MNEQIFESGYIDEDAISKQGTATTTGIIIKSFIGVMIAFWIAIPRLFAGKYFGEVFFRGGFFGDILGIIIFTAIVGACWFALSKALMVDKGVLLNALTFGVASVFSGLFLANGLYIATYYISIYADLGPEIDVILPLALRLTGLITFVAVLAGIFVLPRLSMTGRTIKFAENSAKIVMALVLASFFVLIIGLFLAIFGNTALLEAYYGIFYGIGPVSIVLSIVMVFFAEVLFIGTLAFVKYGIGKVPKHQEYYLSIVIVNGILRLYIEIFKLVLKIIATKNRD